MPASAYINNPITQRVGTSIASKYLPKTATGSIKGGFKPTAGGAGIGVGIGSELLGNYLKPKEDQPIFGGAYGDLTDKYTRRLQTAGPGILGGAVKGAGQGAQYGGWYGAAAGALAGGIYGAAKKHAKTAYSDFKPDDSRSIITDAYRRYLGRDPEEGVVESRLAGQGWKPGDKGVGQYSMTNQLDSISKSPEALAYAASGGTGMGNPNNPINTAPSPGVGGYRPAPINIPSYFQNSPANKEIARRINARAGFTG